MPTLLTILHLQVGLFVFYKAENIVIITNLLYKSNGFP